MLPKTQDDFSHGRFPIDTVSGISGKSLFFIIIRNRFQNAVRREKKLVRFSHFIRPKKKVWGLGAQPLEDLRILGLLDAWKFHFQHLKRETSFAYIEEKIY